MTLTNFNLLPGGICRGLASDQCSVNESFSETMLESLKLVLHGSLIRKKCQTKMVVGDDGQGQNELIARQRLMDYLDEVRESGTVIIGGYFPQVVAQKMTNAQ